MMLHLRSRLRSLQRQPLMTTFFVQPDVLTWQAIKNTRESKGHVSLKRIDSFSKSLPLKLMKFWGTIQQLRSYWLSSSKTPPQNLFEEIVKWKGILQNKKLPHSCEAWSNKDKSNSTHLWKMAIKFNWQATVKKLRSIQQLLHWRLRNQIIWKKNTQDKKDVN